MTKYCRMWQHSRLDHEDCLAEDTFVDDVCGGVLDAESVKQARREEVQWCRGMGLWELVLRKDMNAEGATTVSLRWADTGKGDADRPNYQSRLVVLEIKKAMMKTDVPSAAELFSGMPSLESVTALFSLFVTSMQTIFAKSWAEPQPGKKKRSRKLKKNTS